MAEDMLELPNIKIEKKEPDENKDDFTLNSENDFSLSVETYEMNSSAADILQDGLKSEIKQETIDENLVIDADAQIYMESPLFSKNVEEKMKSSSESQPSCCTSDERILIKTEHPDEDEIDIEDVLEDGEHADPTQYKSSAVRKKFGCHVCSKTFTTKGNLNQHLLIHTG